MGLDDEGPCLLCVKEFAQSHRLSELLKGIQLSDMIKLWFGKSIMAVMRNMPYSRVQLGDYYHPGKK